MFTIRQLLIGLITLCVGFGLAFAQGQKGYLPTDVGEANFNTLKAQSPFRRSLNVSKSLILTGISRIDGDTVATVLDVETHQSFLVSQNSMSSEGWQLVEVKGDQSDLKTLSARVKINGAEVVSIRYEKPPELKRKRSSVMVSTRIGDGSRGGGTGPHGGKDPRVLTPDQLADAKKGARDIRAGIQADGYADSQKIPTDVVNKLSRLSVQQRENINVKMFEYRNRGVGNQERIKIYNNLLDQQLKR